LPERRKLTHVNRVDLPDGRSLELHEAGDPAGFPVIVHHGTPGSGVLYDRWESDGVRLIGFDRAGYGGSSRSAGRAVAAAAADVEALADALELERFATWGISGGGPHALACAALCGSRLTAVASLAGVAPYGAEGLDWLDGMGEDNVDEFELVLAGEEALRPAIERDRGELLGTTPDGLREAWATLLGDADRAATTGSLAVWVHDCMTHGIRDSGDGWIDDNLAFVAAWGFEPAAIDRPVLIVQGGDDRFVPKSHGEWLAGHVPGPEAWLDDTHGHLTILEDLVPDVHAWLLAHS
jgi:pimeloyl-ACP methyl ester carboxylesterase